MNIKRVLLQSALVMVVAGSLAACGDDSDSANRAADDAMTNTGSSVEQVMDQAGDTMDDVGDAVSDKATDVGNAIEDTCEQAKAGVNAEDTDC